MTQSSGSASPTEKAREQVQQVAGQAQERVQDAAQQAQSRMKGEVDNRSTQAGVAVASTAQDLRSVAEGLREQGKDGPAGMADNVADRIERIGTYLRDSDGDRILSDVEGFVRRQPWTVVVGGLTLGFVASRFLKASSSDRYRSQWRPPGDGSPSLPAGDMTYPSTYGRSDLDVGSTEAPSYGGVVEPPVTSAPGVAAPYAGDPLLDDIPPSDTTTLDDRLEGFDDERSSRP